MRIVNLNFWSRMHDANIIAIGSFAHSLRVSCEDSRETLIVIQRNRVSSCSKCFTLTIIAASFTSDVGQVSHVGTHAPTSHRVET